MNTLPARWLTGVFTLFICIFLTMPLFADEADEDGDDQDAASSQASDQASDQAAASADQESGMLEEILITGTRSARGRTATDSTVPIDSFNAQDLSQEAVGDMTDTIRNLVPSYTATPLTGDGTSESTLSVETSNNTSPTGTAAYCSLATTETSSTDSPGSIMPCISSLPLGLVTRRVVCSPRSTGLHRKDVRRDAGAAGRVREREALSRLRSTGRCRRAV